MEEIKKKAQEAVSVISKERDLAEWPGAVADVVEAWEAELEQLTERAVQAMADLVREKYVRPLCDEFELEFHPDGDEFEFRKECVECRKVWIDSLHSLRHASRVMCFSAETEKKFTKLLQMLWTSHPPFDEHPLPEAVGDVMPAKKGEPSD